jgi:hypothetical protein
MAKRKRSPVMSDVLRDTIARSGIPTLILEKETGVARASIRRFLNGERSLRLDRADELSRYFRLRLIHEPAEE